MAVNYNKHNVIASGITLVESAVPSVTTNKLYNIGGSLHFNGVALGGGGYTSWTISDSDGNSESVFTGNSVIFSGANGIDTVYNPTTNVMMISGTNLGGGGSYNWRIADSGGVPDTIANNDLVMFSGANGIETIYNPTNNIMTLSGNYSWTLRDSDNNSKAITNNTPVIFSGVNGIATVYNPTTNIMMVSGTNLGGVTYTAGSGIVFNANEIALSGDNIISSSGFASSAFIQTSGAFVNLGSSFTLNAWHNGKTICSSGNSQVVVTVPTNLPLGFGVAFIQCSGGLVYPSGDNGVTIVNRQGHIRSAGLWSVISLTQYAQNTFVLAGDTGL